MTAAEVVDTYQAVHAYDRALVFVDRRGQIEPCRLQPRDVAILAHLWRHSFLRTLATDPADQAVQGGLG